MYKITHNQSLHVGVNKINFSRRRHDTASRRQSLHGFTLIELLVVIAIISLLLSIILPSLRKVKETAKRMVCGTQLKQVGLAMKMYADAFDGALPPGKGWVWTYGAYRDDQRDSNGKLIPYRWAYLYELDYIDTPEMFYCPSNWSLSFRYDAYTNPGPWGTLPQKFNTDNNGGQLVRVGYTYFPLKRNAKSESDMTEKYTELNPNMPYTTDVLHASGQASGTVTKWLSHKHNDDFSVNMLFPDGHVSVCNDQRVFDDPVWDRFETNVLNSIYTIYRMLHE